MTDTTEKRVDMDFNGISMTELEITLKQMYYFVIVAETGNITRSAQRLYIAQPTLSKSLQQIEDRLGVSLFAHEGRALTLTKTGKYLYRKWKAMLRQYREDLNGIGLLEQNSIRSIRMGCFPVLNSLRFMQRYTDRVAKYHPGVTIEIQRMNYIRLLEYVNANLVDLAFTLDFDLPEKEDVYEWTEIMRCPLVAVIPAAHPLADQDIHSFSQLIDCDFIFSEPEGILTRQSEIERLVRTYNILPEQIHYANNDLTAYLNAEQGHGIAIGIRELYPPHSRRVVIRELDDIDYGVLAVWRRSASPEMKEFIHSVLGR